MELKILCAYPLPVKVSSLVREKLRLSNKEYTELVQKGKIKSSSGQNLQKCRLNGGIVLIFNQKEPVPATETDK